MESFLPLCLSLENHKIPELKSQCFSYAAHNNVTDYVISAEIMTIKENMEIQVISLDPSPLCSVGCLEAET